MPPKIVVNDFYIFFDNFPMFGVCLGSLGSLYCGPPGLMGKDCKPNWRDFAGPSWRSCGMPWSLDVTCYMSSPWLRASRHPCHSCHSYIKNEIQYLFSGLLNIPYSERLGPAWFYANLLLPKFRPQAQRHEAVAGWMIETKAAKALGGIGQPRFPHILVPLKPATCHSPTAVTSTEGNPVVF